MLPSGLPAHDEDMTSPLPLSAMRVSDAEREPVVDRLQQAYADGKLDEPELDIRLHLTMTSKTRADLDAVVSDLGPGPHRAAPDTTSAPEPDPTAEDRVLAALTHFLGAVSLFVGPLVMLCVAGRRSPYLRRHILAALNFQLTLIFAVIVTLGIGAIVYAVSWIVAGVAALLALAGTNFRYPFTLRIIR
jgi:uncharacterized Tic20 family protein